MPMDFMVRQMTGDRSTRRKRRPPITDEQKENIISLHHDGWRNIDIAKHLGVSASVVSKHIIRTV